jgi:hypothetical protein
MTFFPPDPEISEPEESESWQPRWWSSPQDELPALLPVSETLAVTDHLAIALVAVAVYSDGVEFRVDRRLRRNGLPLTEWNELCSTFMEYMPFVGPSGQAGRLRYGMVLGNGEKVLADSPYSGVGDPMTEPQGYVLNNQAQGGGGGGSSYSGGDQLWLWPAPPEGPIELVVQWPALGVDETRVVLDGTEMRELTERAKPYWT